MGRLNWNEVVFTALIGGGEELDFFLCTVDQHLSQGRVIALRTTSEPWPLRHEARIYWGDKVKLITDDSFGVGYEHFQFPQARNRVVEIAEAEGAKVIVHVDADEYFEGGERMEEAIWLANEGNLIAFKTIHHITSGIALDLPGEWHIRAWPARERVRWQGTSGHKTPSQHPVVLDRFLEKLPVLQVEAKHHHLHYALGKKSKDHHTAKTSIDGWPEKAEVVNPGPWPPRVERWWMTGRLPREDFA